MSSTSPRSPGASAALGLGVYNMTKWGVVGFSESLRQEGALIGIRVTCVEPGFVETELQGHNTNPMVVEQIEKNRESIGEVLEPADIAERDRLRGRPAEARERQRDPRSADRVAVGDEDEHD